MARVNTKGQLSGSVGPTYYRQLNGITVLQTKPGKRKKQSKASKVSASEFGIASSAAKKIRLWLFPLLQNLNDAYMHTRFSSKVFQAIAKRTNKNEDNNSLIDGELSILNRFQFNTNTVFEDYCKIQPILNYEAATGLSIALPEFNSNEAIAKIEHATDCELCYLVTAFDQSMEAVTYTDVFKVAVPLHGNTISPQQWNTAVLAADQLLIVTAALFYFRKDKLMGAVPLNSKQLHPCEIVAVFRS